MRVIVVIRLVAVLFFLVLFVSPVSASALYADVKVEVSNDGLVTIHGDTNFPGLLVEDSPDFTSKKGGYWLLNISVHERFSSFIYELHLPRNAVINYLKTPKDKKTRNRKGNSLLLTIDESIAESIREALNASEPKIHTISMLTGRLPIYLEPALKTKKN